MTKEQAAIELAEEVLSTYFPGVCLWRPVDGRYPSEMHQLAVQYAFARGTTKIYEGRTQFIGGRPQRRPER
jgi:hypothetical protein